MGDFNPGFSFDFGVEGAQKVQAPWEFAGALKHAEKSQGTSIDYKIQKQLSQRKQSNGTANGNGRRASPPPSSSESEDERDSEEEQEDHSSEEDQKEIEYGLDDSSDEEGIEEDSNDEDEDEEEHLAIGQKRGRNTTGRINSDESSEEEDEEAEGMSTDGEEEEEKSEKGEQDQPAMKRPKTQQPSGKKGAFYDAAPKGTTFSAQSFADLNLSRPLVRACQALGYARPTPIQAACIPLALTGRDICGSAITGSGKTAAFALPLLERLLHRNKRVAATYVLILAPTRELAVQVHSMVQKLAQFTDIRAALVVGGLSLHAQAADLRASPEVIVATPGRLIDHLRNSQGFGLEDLACLILDEADRLLEMGFKEEIREIVRMAPSKRQTMLFSATMTEEVKYLASLSLRHPVRLAADATAASPASLKQEIIRLKGGQVAIKEAILMALASRQLASSGRAIVFFSTKQRAHRAKILFGLAKLPPAAELHGDMTQAARLEALERFRTGEAAFLLATDVAARGLDILGVQTVVNYDCPRSLEAYLHRIGRTARAGSSGQAITFVEDGDRNLVKNVVKKGGVRLDARKVASAAVHQWQNKLEVMHQEVYKVLQEERAEAELRRAEMEAQKAENIMQHEAEIYSRPARTWFQSEKQKKELKEKSWRAAYENVDEDSGEDEQLPASVQKKIDKNTAKSARRMERKLHAAKEEAEKKKGRNTLMDETAAVTRKVRGIKARTAALREQGVSAGKATKIAASMVTGMNTESSKKKKKKAKAAGENGGTKESEGGLFSGDGLGKKPSGAKNSRVYAGGAKTGKAKAPSTRLEGAALKKLKRGGKGKGSFKSKSKHRRR